MLHENNILLTVKIATVKVSRVKRFVSLNTKITTYIILQTSENALSNDFHERLCYV